MARGGRTGRARAENGQVMRVRAVTILAMLSVAVVPLPGRAATIEVEIRDQTLIPRGVHAVAGDEITWRVTNGNHNLQAYQNASFQSGLMGPQDTFTTPFAGGAVLYRCVFPGHSELAEDGTCSGMCGIISDQHAEVEPPTITRPTDGEEFDIKGADLEGTAPGATRVLVFADGIFKVGIDVNVGGTWSRFVEFPNGQYTIAAIAEDELGFRSQPSDPVSFTIAGPDTEPPRLQLSDPGELIVTNPLLVRGVASDDSGVDHVTVELVDLLGGMTGMSVNCEGCGTQTAHFAAQMPVTPGVYRVVARATDVVGKTGEVATTVLVL